MSETSTNLLSGVVGAIVGGAASLAGTMLVNKRQMATNARIRLYDELLPNLASHIHVLLDSADYETVVEANKQMPELLAKVRRATAIAGPRERKVARYLTMLWSEIGSIWSDYELPGVPFTDYGVDDDPPDPPGTKPAPGSSADRSARHKELLRAMREEIGAFSDHLGAKLG
jgi:hypothetical protein